MTRIVHKVSGIFIPVTDMKRSIEWYKRAFGLETVDASDSCTGLAFPGEATILNLWKVERPQPTEFDAGGYRIPYYNFESFDIDYSHRALRDIGAEVLPIVEDAGDIRFFDCLDPDGNKLSIVEELPPSPYYAHKQTHRRS